VSDLNDLTIRYIAAWNEPDADSRARAVAALWTEDGSYTDPLAAVEGHQGIMTVITKARQMFPGHVFTLSGNVDAHHNVVRFGWALAPAGAAEPAVIGFDVAVAAPDGRLQSVYGFLDKAPAA
jgi:SnoaL-like protein